MKNHKNNPAIKSPIIKSPTIKFIVNDNFKDFITHDETPPSLTRAVNHAKSEFTTVKQSKNARETFNNSTRFLIVNPQNTDIEEIIKQFEQTNKLIVQVTKTDAEFSNSPFASVLSRERYGQPYLYKLQSNVTTPRHQYVRHVKSLVGKPDFFEIEIYHDIGYGGLLFLRYAVWERSNKPQLKILTAVNIHSREYIQSSRQLIYLFSPIQRLE